MKALIVVCCLVLLAGHAVCGLLLYDSFRPHRAARMVLMGMPVVAGVMLIPALAVIVIHSRCWCGAAFRRWTLPIAWAGFLWFVVLFVFG